MQSIGYTNDTTSNDRIDVVKRCMRQRRRELLLIASCFVFLWEKSVKSMKAQVAVAIKIQNFLTIITIPPPPPPGLGLLSMDSPPFSSSGE